MKKLVLALALGANSLFAALGDKIDMDASNTTVDGSALEAGGVTTGAFKLWSRTCCEIGFMNNDNSVSTKNSTETLAVTIPEQTGVNRYELKLYGKQKNYDVIYDIAIDANSAVNTTVPAAAEADDVPYYYSSSVVTGAAHTATISGTNATTNWIEFDYFEVVAIPAPELAYSATQTDSVATDFSGAIGTVSISNQASLLGDAATITLSDNDNFSFSAGTLSFTVPASPVASYTVTITADHMGETDTEEVTVNVKGTSGGGVSINGLQGVQAANAAFKVYDLQGNLVKASHTSRNWKEGVQQGMYITQSAAGQKLEVVK